MTDRFCEIGYLKPDKIDEYRRLHSKVWPEVLNTIRLCNLHSYSIYLKENIVVSVYEYTGDDFEEDMRKMALDPVTIEWWKHTKPCFEYHAEGRYYETMEEIFHQD